MGLGQWVIIIVLVAVLIFGFAAVFDWGKGVVKNVYPFQVIRVHADGHHTTTTAIINDTEPFLFGNVSKVIDGDTIDLQSGERIRMSIVNTPERGHLGYTEAKQFTTSACLGKQAFVDLDDGQPNKSYNRLIGAIYCDINNDNIDLELINFELIQLGHGVVMTKYCKMSEFREKLCP
jgi:micrococcal nuclease